MSLGTDEEGLSVSEIHRILWESRFFIAICVCIALAGAYLYGKTQIARYKATAMVAYKNSDQSQPLLNQVTEIHLTENNAIEHYLPMFRTSNFMQKVGTMLLLSSDATELRFESQPGDVRPADLMRWILTKGAVPYPSMVVTSSDLIEGKPLSSAALLGMMRFIGDPAQSLITIEATTTTPDSAALLANKAAESVLKFTLSSGLASIIETKLFLEKELAVMRSRIDKDSASIIMFKEENQKIAIPQAAIALATQVADYQRRIADMESKLSGNKKLLAYYEAKWEDQRARMKSDTAMDAGSPKVVNRLTDYINELKLRKLQLQAQGITAGHEEMKDLDEKITSTKAILDREADSRMAKGNDSFINPLAETESLSLKIATIHDENKRLEVEGSSLRSSLQAQQLSMKDMPQQEIELASLEMRQKLNNDMYLNLTKRLHEIQIQEAGARSEWEIVDRAVPPGAASNASSLMRFLVPALSGVLAAILLIFVNQSLRSPLRAVPAPESHTRLLTLASMPRLRGRSFKLKTALTAVGEDASRLLVTEQPHYEAVMNAVYASVFRLAEAGVKSGAAPVIVITSPSAGDGKSVVAANLAVGFAATGLRTTLVDGHFQKPQIQNIFKVPFSTGLASLINGVSDSKSISYGSRFPGLSIVPRGTAFLAPSQITLAAQAKALERIRKGQDVVIIDAGSIKGDSSAMLWASLATDIIIVVRHGISLHASFKEALPRVMDFNNARVWGMLNDKPVQERLDFLGGIQRSVRKGSAVSMR